ncbi:hypothetical protein [Candidatus Binatus sp.]
MKSKVEDLEFKPKEAFENLRSLAKKVLTVPKTHAQAPKRRSIQKTK